MIENSQFIWSAYLRSKGILCSTVEVLDEQRNEVVRVRTNSGRELVLKRGVMRTPAGDGALLNEGLVYQIFNELKITDLAPRCILHDRNSDILLMEYVKGKTARQNWEHIKTDQQAWASLGMILARMHIRGVHAPDWSQRLLGDFDELIPSAHPLRPENLIAASPGQIQIIRAIQSDSLIRDRLSELAASKPITLIHGDARLDNILMSSDNNIYLIDFELSRVGDPLFDLGTLVGSVLEYIAMSTTFKEEDSAGQFIDCMVNRSFIQSRSIIAGYRATMRAEEQELLDPEEFLARLSEFVGIHLLHRAGALAYQFYAETRIARLFTIAGCAFVKNPSYLLRPLKLDASYNWLNKNWGILE